MDDKQKVVAKLEGRGEVEKWSECLDDRNKLIDFMSFLAKKEFSICRYPTKQEEVMEGCWLPINQSVDKLINEYFGIDEVKLEEERQEILEGLNK